MLRKPFRRVRHIVWLPVLLAALLVPSGAWATAAPPSIEPAALPPNEHPSPDYDSILYAEIGPRLRQIEAGSSRVRVDVAGQSAGGRDLYLVTVAAPEALARLGRHQGLRRAMLEDPDLAETQLAGSGLAPIPVFLNAGTRGYDYAGVDAAMHLIETLAYDQGPEATSILDDVILLVNVVHNPDGRVMGTSRNRAGFDLARDLMTQSQPETRAAVAVLAEWNPIVAIDLRGLGSPMQIQPASLPDGARHDYDLFTKWALQGAQAMRDQVQAQTGLSAQVPLRDPAAGQGDWPPISLASYAQYHGAYSFTLEAPYRDRRGVDALYAAVWGALEFVAENRETMVRDQIELFRLGLLSVPQVAIPDRVLEQPPYGHHPDWTRLGQPAAYVIPASPPLQNRPHEAARLVDLLRANGVELDQARHGFQLDGVPYPAGTYIVRLEQPKRGLIDAFLWAGRSGAFDPGGSLYDLAGWSHPMLWGVSRVAVPSPVDVASDPAVASLSPRGSVEGSGSAGFAIPPAAIESYQAANDLLDSNLTLYRTTAPFSDSGRQFSTGTLVLPAEDGNTALLADDLARRYGLALYGLDRLPPEAALLYSPRIAVVADEGVRAALTELGFRYDHLSAADLDAGDLAHYDVLVNDRLQWQDLYPSGRASLASFLQEGGDYVGIGPAGIEFASSGVLLDFEFETAPSGHHGLLRLDCDPADTVISQLGAGCYGLAPQPVWFNSWTGVSTVSASLTERDFLASGFWPTSDSTGAGGKPVILHGRHGAGHVTLFGINPTFRAHPRDTFRLLANAIYSGLD